MPRDYRNAGTPSLSVSAERDYHGSGGDEQAADEGWGGKFFAQQQPGEDNDQRALSLSNGTTREAGPSCGARPPAVGRAALARHGVHGFPGPIGGIWAPGAVPTGLRMNCWLRLPHAEARG